MPYILDEITVIAADLDGTLALSKTRITDVMALTISKWLESRRFVVISGGKYDRFEHQILTHLPQGTHLENLYLFPTNGAACYTFKNGAWVKLYEDTLTESEQSAIIEAIQKTITASAINMDETFGEQIENRGGEVTFSALGQQAPIEKKLPWDADQAKRKEIVSHLAPLLPDFEVSIGGTTSIDVTKKGVDKAYAIGKMKDLLAVDTEHIIFFGDALFEGGNDWPVMSTDVTCVKVDGPENTIAEINKLLK